QLLAIYRKVNVFAVGSQVTGQLLDTEFQPTVTATCKAGHMTIRVNLNQSFVGAVHARDFRTPQCMAPGNGSTHATLAINLLAPKGSPDYCGVLVNNDTEERSIPIAVRIHKTLELADDKFYVITCGKAGFKNAKYIQQFINIIIVVYRCGIGQRSVGMYGIKVKSCFAFNKRNTSVQLIDDKGCPVKARVMTKFIYDRNTGLADATLFSMFRFPDSPQVHFQCDIAVCRGKPIRSVISDYDLGFDLGYSVPFNSTRPVQLTYTNIPSKLSSGPLFRTDTDRPINPRNAVNRVSVSFDHLRPTLARDDFKTFLAFGFQLSITGETQNGLSSFPPPGSCGIPVCEGDNEEDIKGASLINGQSVSGEEGVLLAGTSVFVLDPGQTPSVQTLYEDGSVHPLWLLWLAVALGILFLIMLIINIFLCSAMTCSCTRTDIIEKEPSIIEDYDPYRSWHGSQYGSRYSLNGKQGYASGGSTMNSTRSISTNSDHYAIVHSRPGSRYSGPGQKQHHHHHRGPPSNIGSHYSGK
ncbi:hypothetical protein E2986_09966, partial [Frieseomelitta varia]